MKRLINKIDKLFEAAVVDLDLDQDIDYQTVVDQWKRNREKAQVRKWGKVKYPNEDDSAKDERDNPEWTEDDIQIGKTIEFLVFSNTGYGAGTETGVITDLKYAGDESFAVVDGENITFNRIYDVKNK